MENSKVCRCRIRGGNGKMLDANKFISKIKVEIGCVKKEIKEFQKELSELERQGTLIKADITEYEGYLKGLEFTLEELERDAGEA